jgi:hypothetical protein
MESLLVRLMILAAVGELGLAAFGGGICMSKACLANIDRASRNISRIDWKPISVFPEEAKRFK